jgi:hypothetical protein
MNFPGFTAEESLKRSDRYYFPNTGSTTIPGSILMSPAQAPIVSGPVAGVGRVLVPAGFGDWLHDPMCPAKCNMECRGDLDCLRSCMTKCGGFI